MSAKKNHNNKFIFDKENKLFHKFPSQLMLKSELEMTLKAKELSDRSGLFYVPNVVDYTKDKLIFELLACNTSLRAYFLKSTKTFSMSKDNLVDIRKVFFNVGLVLGEIHSNNQVFLGVKKKYLDLEFNINESDNVYLHGDFSISNVLYDVNLKRISVIDWSLSQLFSSPANYGPRYWDLTFFISTFFYASLSTYYSYKLREILVREFLLGYLEKTQIDRNIFSNNLGQFIYQFNTYELYDKMNNEKVSGLKSLLWQRSKSKLLSFSKRIEQDFL